MIDYKIHHGNCLETLRGMADSSVDSIVTDPPYGLSKQPDMAEVLRHWLAGDDYTHTGGGFMGKSWDSFVPGPSVWREALRVLKPGGYALVFAGSRTQDLMSISLRLAGFEIRDTAFWFYGSGFPKSLDVSKAVEKAHGIGASRERALKFTAWMRSTGITAAQINEATGASTLGEHYLSKSNGFARVATLDMFEKMRHLLPEPPTGILELMQWRTVESENMKRREVVGKQAGTLLAVAPGQDNDRSGVELDITTAHTDEAKQWEGWGTALKPAYEPIIIARKPLEGTVADNVLTHGVGAINVDGCRTGERWPANILHDGCFDDEPWGRYFYAAKASKADRNEGCEHLEYVAAGGVTGGRAEGSDGLKSPRAGAGRTAGGYSLKRGTPPEVVEQIKTLLNPRD